MHDDGGTDRVSRSPDISALGAMLLARVDDLGAELADTVLERVVYYAQSTTVSIESLRGSCTDNLRYVFTALAASTELDVSPAESTGSQRALGGVPLPEILAAYRVGFGRVWELIVTEARATDMSADEVLAATAYAMSAHDRYSNAAAIAYNREQTRRLIHDEQRRSALVDALITGKLVERHTLWEIADLLGLPTTGPYVVVAISLAEIGRPAIADVRNQLAGRQVISAWRLMADLQIGVVAVSQPDYVTRVTALLDEVATTPVGVSPPYADLAETAVALRLARIANAGSRPDSLVTGFADSPLTVTAVSAPEVMRRVATTVLGPLDALPDDDRAALMATLAAWIDAGGSTAIAAERLYLHPNTVRQRLNRISKRTGRSLTDPTAVAELCVALETMRRLPTDTAT